MCFRDLLAGGAPLSIDFLRMNFLAAPLNFFEVDSKSRARMTDCFCAIVFPARS
jgi:hypothetical protein